MVSEDPKTIFTDGDGTRWCVPNVLDRSKMSVLLEANGLTNTWILVRMHNLCGRSLIFTN